jgi:F-type H+-transporting ATPase subunit epsilon
MTDTYMNKIKFSITTPEKTVYSEEIDQVTLPTQMGEITVMPHHVPLIALLKPGEMLLTKDKDVTSMAVSGGFIEIRTNEVVVLADTAERSEEIDEQRAEEARQKAEKLMSEKRVDSVEYAGLMAKMEKELARLHVKRRRRHER